MQTEHQLPLFGRLVFRDSGRVLTAIVGHLESLKGELAILREVGGTGVSGRVAQARESTLDYISEEVEHAPKTTLVYPRS